MRLELEAIDGQLHGGANTVLVPEIAAKLGGALGTLLGEGAIVVTARDNYPPSRMIKRAFTAGLMSTGVTVMDFHAATTPELVFAIKRLGAKAGVQFTISPLTREGIAIKFFDAQGLAYSRDKIHDILERSHRNRIVRTLPNLIGWVTYAEYIHDIYVAAAVSYIDAASIASERFGIVYDVNFGPASDVLPSLLSEVGIEGVLLNSHRPPIRGRVAFIPPPESITNLCRIVGAADASFGAALSTDASCVLLVDNEGKPLTAEEMTAIIMEGLPSGASIVISEQFFGLIDNVAKLKGIRLARVRGTLHEMQRFARRINAYVIVSCQNEVVFTDFSLAPDGLLTTLKIAEILSRTNNTLSSIREKISEIPLSEASIKLGDVDYLQVLRMLRTKYRESAPSFNGVRVRADGVWVSVEIGVGEVKVIAEASERGERAVDKVAMDVKEIVRSLERESL